MFKLLQKSYLKNAVVGLISWMIFTTFAWVVHGTNHGHVVKAFVPTQSMMSKSMNTIESIVGYCNKGQDYRHKIRIDQESSTSIILSPTCRTMANICKIRGGTKVINKKTTAISENSSSSFDKEQQTSSVRNNNNNNRKVLVPIGITAATITAIGIIAHQMGYLSSFNTLWVSILRFLSNPQQTLQNVIESVKNVGPLGLLYFGLIYFAFDLCSIPAIPLAMSAGYLFGFTKGLIVILSASTAAQSASFFIGKTFLRNYIEKNILSKNAKLLKLDKAIGKDGFKLLLLLRITPIFALPLVNYVFGASSINYFNYFWGTLFGCLPGTLLFLYTGMVGKELSSIGNNSQPWYFYAVGLSVIVLLLKLLTDVASDIVNAIGDDDDKKDEKKVKK